MRISTRFRVPLLLPMLALMATACGGEPAEEPGGGDVPPAPEPAPAESTPSDATDAALLDPEQATEEELMAVEGLTAPAVEALIAGRPYGDMTEVDVLLAEHLDEAEREAVYAAVWKPMDLNTASTEEILLVPGVGEQMAHEFEEYRPYRAMAEFHREIGKYVDEEEVQRLARYVEIR